MAFLFKCAFFLLLITLCHGNSDSSSEERDRKESEMPEANAKTTSPTTVATPKYNILAVLMCYRGHINPGAGVVRALTKNKHKVHVIVTSSCKERVQQLMPDVGDSITEIQILPETDFGTSIFEQFEKFRLIVAENGTTAIYESMDLFFTQWKEAPFDAMFIDFMLTGALLAAKKHNVPTVVQSMGPIIDSKSSRSSTLDKISLKSLNGLSTAFWEVIGGAMFDLYISQKVFGLINEIHAKNGWELTEYHNGLHPFAYQQQNAIIISHAAEPISRQTEGDFVPNVYPIGFVPDEFMYSQLSPELTNWLEATKGPVVYISLGTVFSANEHYLAKMFDSLRSQQQYYFIWAVKPNQMKQLKERGETTRIESERLFLGSYLPQGTILQHEKIKLFVTHCGSNSVQDAIYGKKPMITYPGFGDQIILSNILVQNGVAKPMNTFDFEEMSSLIDVLLEPTLYQNMTNILHRFKKRQTSLGGFTKAAQIVEDVIEKRIKVEKTDPEYLFGAPLTEMKLVLVLLAVVLVILSLSVLLIFVKVVLAIIKTSQKDLKPKEHKTIKKE